MTADVTALLPLMPYCFAFTAWMIFRAFKQLRTRAYAAKIIAAERDTATRQMESGKPMVITGGQPVVTTVDEWIPKMWCAGCNTVKPDNEFAWDAQGVNYRCHSCSCMRDDGIEDCGCLWCCRVWLQAEAEYNLLCAQMAEKASEPQVDYPKKVDALRLKNKKQEAELEAFIELARERQVEIHKLQEQKMILKKELEVAEAQVTRSTIPPDLRLVGEASNGVWVTRTYTQRVTLQQAYRNYRKYEDAELVGISQIPPAVVGQKPIYQVCKKDHKHGVQLKTWGGGIVQCYDNPDDRH
jgi:hypothetical protein